MRNINQFYVKQDLDFLCGKVKNASQLGNGTLFVDVFTENQSNAHLKATLLGSYPMWRDTSPWTPLGELYALMLWTVFPTRQYNPSLPTSPCAGPID
jgi:hypothetical protein